MPVDPALAPFLGDVDFLGSELTRRRAEAARLNGYDEGACPFPTAVIGAGLTKAYRMLMPMAEAPWGSLVVGTSLDRLEVKGIRDDDTDAAERAWRAWQDNQMDSESRLVHHSALVTGRAFALVWDDGNGNPEVTLENSEQMIVRYAEGSRRQRVSALRRWMDEQTGRPMATLYRPEALYKFQGPKNSSGFAGTQWEPRLEDDEWPLRNPYGVVPVVELAINRRLKPGSFGYAQGDFAHCTGLIDRINLLTFLGLVVAFWMGFPLRGVIGERILKDDDGNVVPPFDANADGFFQLENPQAKIVEYSTADRKNLAVYTELDQLATITRTPRHYFPLEGGMSNIAADTIRANEGSLHAKIRGDYKPSLGEGWEEVLRLCTRIQGGGVLSPRAELQWHDHEYRSLAERADAVSKFAAAGFPWAAIADLALDVTDGQVARWNADGAMGQLLQAAQDLAPTNGAVPVA